MLDNLKKYKNIHFIGLGGIGMSALAQILHSQGHIVSGSDRYHSPLLTKLEQTGIYVMISQDASNITPKHDLIIYSSAIDEKNPEFEASKNLHKEMLSYPEAVGLLSQNLKTIAICGTHGKTTTTALAAIAFLQNSCDPNVIVGALIPELGKSNYRIGKSDWLILEACEYKNAFHNYFPSIAIITNIEPDHLDFFRTAEAYFKSFTKFLSQIPENGIIIANADDANLEKILQNLPKSERKIITYGTSKNANFRLEENKIYHQDGKQTILEMTVPGKHNLMNATAVITLAHTLNLDFHLVKTHLEKYQGASRRFEIKGQINKTTIIDDYAHHPTEIRTTLAAVKSKFGTNTKILCIFQPHQYSRTHQLLQEFATSFQDATKVIIPNIYEARDTAEDKAKINVDLLVETINETRPNLAQNGKDLENTLKTAQNELNNFDVVITMGAGDINQLSEKLST